MIPVWMLRDPETERIALQIDEPGDDSFPRGTRGRNWEIRRGEIDEASFAALLAGGLPPEEQTRLHLEAWNREDPDA